MCPWILGVGFHEVFAIIVLVISVLSWFVNLIQGNAPNGMQKPQRPKGRPQTTRSELEELIQELTTDKRKAEQRKESPAPVRPKPERPRPAVTPPRPGSPPPFTPSRPAPAVAEPKRPVGNRVSSPLGEGIRGHHIGSRIENQPPQTIMTSLAPSIDNRTTSSMPVQERSMPALVQLLREPAGIRQAMILNEILQRPKSLRR